MSYSNIAIASHTEAVLSPKEVCREPFTLLSPEEGKKVVSSGSKAGAALFFFT